MGVKEIIEARRAYRSIEPVKVTDELIKDLAHSAQLAPSCYNKQPWRFVFVHGDEAIAGMRDVFAKGNEWCHNASLVVAVFTKTEFDCKIKEREYALFDTGLAAAFMVLRATELGLVAHPIAGYDEEKAKETLGIPAEMRLITLILIGGHAKTYPPQLNAQQIEGEKQRPERLPFEQFAFINKYREG